MIDALFADLVASVREMKAIERGALPAPVQHERTASHVTQVRQRLRLTQPRFAQLLGISVRTLQNWEQGHREPTGAAKVLLRIAEKHPDAVLDCVE